MMFSSGRRACLHVTALLLAAYAPALAQDKQPVRVQVYLASEYSPEWARLGDTLDAADYTVTVSLASMTSENLADFDVLIVRYSRLDSTWTAPMTEAAKEFVRRGGGLLVLGHGARWADTLAASAQYPVYQANRLLKEFGFSFETAPPHCRPRGRPVLVSTEAEVSFAEYEPSEEPGVVTDTTGSGRPILAAPGGEVVAAWKSYGHGRIVAFGDPDGLVPGGANHAFIEALLALLSPRAPREGASSPPAVLWPQVRLRYRMIEVAASETALTRAQAVDLEALMRLMVRAVERITDVRCEAPVRAVALPDGAPQERPDDVVARGVTSADTFPLLAATATAVARGCLRPAVLPGALDDAWCLSIALDALTSLGYPEAMAERHRLASQFAEADPKTLKEIDPTVTQTDPSLEGLATLKAVWLLRELESRYSRSLVQHLGRAVNNLRRRAAQLDAEAFARVLERSGALGVRDFLREHGVDLKDEPPPRFGW